MMTDAEFEDFYESLAETLDSVIPEKRPLFLMKLALLLAKDSSQAERALRCIAEANQNLSV
jgi:hypothetical protein